MQTLTVRRMELISVTEAAKYLGISRQAVLSAIEEGRMAAKKVGRQWVIRKVELEKYKVSEVRQNIGLRRRHKKEEKT